MPTVTLNNEYAASYNSNGFVYELCKFTAPVKCKITSISFNIGTGNAMYVYSNGGNPLYLIGNGSSLNIYMNVGGTYTSGHKYSSGGTNSGTKSVTNKVGSTRYDSGYGFTAFTIDKSDLISYTFTFSNPQTFNKDSSISIGILTPSNRQTSSEATATPGPVLCMNNTFTVTYEEVQDNFTVTFKDHDGKVLKTQSVAPGGSATPPSDPTRTGFTFSGWSGSYTNVTSNRTITATYTEITYTVTYNENGGTGAPSPQIKRYTQNLTLTTTRPSKIYTVTYNANGGTVNPISKSIDCGFVGWNTKADGTGRLYDLGESYSTNANVTLYAIYSDPKFGTLATPTRANCRFNKWTSSLNGGSKITSDTTLTKSTTIYAMWEYKVTINANNGVVWKIGQESSQFLIDEWILHGQSISLSQYSCLHTLGEGEEQEIDKKFLGYSLSATSTSASINYDESYTVTNPVVLYAIYQINRYLVQFVDGYSRPTRVLKEQIVNHGGSATPPSDPTRPDHIFLGWLGNYKNVKSNSVVVARWSFTPVWIMTSKGWRKYEPKEDKEVNNA